MSRKRTPPRFEPRAPSFVGIALAPMLVLGVAISTLIIPQRLGWGRLPPWLGIVGVSACILTLVLMGIRVSLFARRIERSDGFLCLNCHYDLHGLPDDGDCPECGESYERARLERLWGIWLQDHTKNRKYLQPRQDSPEAHAPPIPVARGPNTLTMTVIPVVLLAPLTLGSVSLISARVIQWWMMIPLWLGLPLLAVWNARRAARFQRRLKAAAQMLCPRCGIELRRLDGGEVQCPKCSRRMTEAAVKTSWERFRRL